MEARRSTDAYRCLLAAGPPFAALGATPRRSAGGRDTERPRCRDDSVSLVYRAVELCRPPPPPFSAGAGNLDRPRPTLSSSSSSSDSALARKNSSARSSRLTSGGNAPPRTLLTNLEDGVAASSGDGDGGGNRLRLLDRRTLLPPPPPLPPEAACRPRVAEPASSRAAKASPRLAPDRNTAAAIARRRPGLARVPSSR